MLLRFNTDTRASSVGPKTLRKWSIAIAGLALALSGCGITLEDGYKPRPLGASPEVRKSYYASPFSPEAEAGQQQQQSSSPMDTGMRQH